MKARQRLDSGISSASSGSEKQGEIKCTDSVGDKSEYANVQGDITAGQFETDVQKQCEIKIVPVGETARHNATETYCRRLSQTNNFGDVTDNAQERDIKPFDGSNDDTRYILKTETIPKKGIVSEGDTGNVDRSKSEFLNKTTERVDEVKLDCELVKKNCDWQRCRNSVCSEHSLSTAVYEFSGERLNSSLSVPYKLCTVPNAVSKGYIDVTRRCDDLLNELQQLALKNIAFRKTYANIRKSFYILALLNIILIMCMLINFPILLARTGNRQGNSAAHEDAAAQDHSPGTICFNCSELNQDTGFSLETLTNVRQKNGLCCFWSIISVLTSIKRNVQTVWDNSLQYIKKSLVQTDKRLVALEAGSLSDTSQIVGRILQVVSPQEKTIVYLRSIKDTPVVMDPTFNGNYNKIRWDRDGQYTIQTDGISLSRKAVNIEIKSEGHYFIYTKVQFNKRRRLSYQDVPLSYLIYRQRGSTATYVHEARINCIFNDKTQEHSSTSEMVLHLNRDDKIFLSVDDHDKDFLSTESGAHTFVMFEL